MMAKVAVLCRMSLLTGLAIALPLPGCAQSGREDADRAKVAFEVLVEVDKQLQSDFALKVAQLKLATTERLPKGNKCEGLLLANYVLETERMEFASQARLLQAEAGSAAVRFIVSKSKPSPGDFDEGQPAREVADKMVQALLVMNKAEATKLQKLIAKELEAEAISDGCLTEEYERARGAGEIVENEFYATYVRNNADRLKALIKNIRLLDLYNESRAFRARREEVRLANPKYSEAKARADAIRNRTITPELRSSRERLETELLKSSAPLR